MNNNKSIHEVEVEDGAEYNGETYIRCACGAIFNDGHKKDAVQLLIQFLHDHGAL